MCEKVHLNLAYRWFRRLGLDDEVTDHSIFSKNRYGRFRDFDLLRTLFETVVRRCMAEGLVDGAAFAVDASLIAADAGLAIVAASTAVSLRALYGPIYNISVIINSIPIIATAPLLALWLGTGAQVQIVIAALSSQFPMLVGTMQGLQAAETRQRELMHVLYASRLQTLRYLLIPSALPYLFAGLKIAAPSAVLGAITAEWAGADQGVGAMMLYALFSYDTPKVWLSVVLTCLLAGAGFAIWAAIERIAIYWRHDIELAD